MATDIPAIGVGQVAQAIQLSVAPVFLLAGIGGFLNVCAGRLARIVDRARTIEPQLLDSRGGEHDRLVGEIRVLDRRITIVNTAVWLSVLSAVLICLVVVLLFAAVLFQVHVATLIALLYIVSMVALAAGFACFIVETRIGSRLVHVRNDLLEHTAPEE